ncbi:hypothetical protein [Micavibrio aeruginosavorus]|uniref:Uncharacterized protein n=1 Tax=Micavibrio aeruginosavorus (strain ARL-13) TaxID=856793 RepID=G2KQB5_MICAA|nr:hypothetical protein [Micavibrio aeruginosavorus]AEP09051.1 hypothetical protein MICA_717 [Micavibrio aeruginosavorus ARL-13]
MYRMIIKAQNPRDVATQPIDEIIGRAASLAPIMAHLGNWPATLDSTHAMTDRIPEGDRVCAGFDPGLACALGFVPRHAQALLATLHAAYTPGAVLALRAGIDFSGTTPVIRDADAPSTWWFAAVSLCDEDNGVDEAGFRAQIAGFQNLVDDPQARVDAANVALLHRFVGTFSMDRGYPFGTVDGCQQAAYIMGHAFGVMHRERTGTYYIGTYLDSLGLEKFVWSTELDDRGRPKSGPNQGSQQFVKCADEDELKRAMAVVLQNPIFAKTCVVKSPTPPAPNPVP